MRHESGMLSETEATIYLATQRGCTQSGSFRCFHTFNFGAYENKYRSAFRNLSSFNDQTLKAGRSVSFSAPSPVAMMLIPVIGNIEFKSPNFTGDLDAGEAHVIYLAKGDIVELYNPYKQEMINFLHVWFTVEPGEVPENSSAVMFDIGKSTNKLQCIIPDGREPFTVVIGKFKSRSHGAAAISRPGIGAFVFVIEGAFEVAGRLLEKKDGLALWNTRELTFEALSNDAIILVIEPGRA